MPSSVIAFIVLVYDSFCESLLPVVAITILSATFQFTNFFSFIWVASTSAVSARHVHVTGVTCPAKRRTKLTSLSWDIADFKIRFLLLLFWEHGNLC